MKSKTPIFLTSCVLAVSLFTALATQAAPDVPMPDTATFDENPSAQGSFTNKNVLVYGTDPKGNKVPLKTLRITNNSADTVYPIMRDPNSSVTADKSTGLYDPYDMHDREYRGYIGYKNEAGKYCFGLKTGETILVSIPLVFWNGARIGIETDATYLTSEAPNPHPLNYHHTAAMSITAAETVDPNADKGDVTIIKNGVVMWYNAPVSEAPNDDTEDQLAEWTIRDHNYMSTPVFQAATKGEMPDNQLLDLINYDVSNVDNLYLPLAMEALDAWVFPGKVTGTGPHKNRDSWSPGSHPEAYGWTGATNDVKFLQDAFKDFVAPMNSGSNAPKNTLLGDYFGGKGWPYYRFPNPTKDPNQAIKIPSGANVFAQSPIKGTATSYQGNADWAKVLYMLSSGGDQPIFAGFGWSGVINDQPNQSDLHLGGDPQPPDPQFPKAFDYIKPGYLVVGSPPDPKKNPIQKGTHVLSVDPTNRSVKLDKPLAYESKLSSFDFYAPVEDYAANAMIKLWYSWAEYYIQNYKGENLGALTAGKPIAGSMGSKSATLNFQTPQSDLTLGMSVTGPGLDNAQTESGPHQGDAVILAIASDKQSVIVSQVAAEASSGQYTISPPKPLLWTPTKEGDPGYPLIWDKFKFSGEPEYNDPYKFSQKVYMIMASMNQISVKDNSDICKFMQDIIGANMGYIFDEAGKESDDGMMVTSMIRDMIKSVLRGVTDFTQYPDKLSEDGKTHLVWYPDPAKPTGGQSFNVFNLDPFVRFVHVNLGFSGYGFSVDDDTADVGAGGASHLQLSVTGTKGLAKATPWTIQAPFGPVTATCHYSGPNNTDKAPGTVVGASGTTPIKITTQAPHHLKNGGTIQIDQVLGNTAANGIFKIGNVTKDTFDLYNLETGAPIASNGQYPTAISGRWYHLPTPYINTGSDPTLVFYRVVGDDPEGVFQGTPVSIQGLKLKPLADGERPRIMVLGKYNVGQLLLNDKLVYADGTDVPEGDYPFVFGGDGTP